jgi:hypothetical protein
MIHYQLRCSREHGFDGWFKDSAAFDAQAQRGLISCPECGDTAVNRALMAPPVARQRRATVDQVGQPQPEKAAVMPDAVRAALQRLRADVERHCDYVGGEFAEEARRIHRGESERKGIYGETTPDEAQSLAEEGIEVARVPWLPRADG